MQFVEGFSITRDLSNYLAIYELFQSDVKPILEMAGFVQQEIVSMLMDDNLVVVVKFSDGTDAKLSFGVMKTATIYNVYSKVRYSWDGRSSDGKFENFHLCELNVENEKYRAEFSVDYPKFSLKMFVNGSIISMDFMCNEEREYEWIKDVGILERFMEELSGYHKECKYSFFERVYSKFKGDVFMSTGLSIQNVEVSVTDNENLATGTKLSFVIKQDNEPYYPKYSLFERGRARLKNVFHFIGKESGEIFFVDHEFGTVRKKNSDAEIKVKVKAGQRQLEAGFLDESYIEFMNKKLIAEFDGVQRIVSNFFAN